MEDKNTTKTKELDMSAVYDDAVATDLYWKLQARLELLERNPSVAERERFLRFK